MCVTNNQKVLRASSWLIKYNFNINSFFSWLSVTQPYSFYTVLHFSIQQRRGECSKIIFSVFENIKYDKLLTYSVLNYLYIPNCISFEKLQIFKMNIWWHFSSTNVNATVPAILLVVRCNVMSLVKSKFYIALSFNCK